MENTIDGYVESVRAQYLSAPQMIDYDEIRQFQLSVIEQIDKESPLEEDAVKAFVVSLFYQNPYYYMEDVQNIKFIETKENDSFIADCDFANNLINISNDKIRRIARADKDSLEELLLIVMAVAHELKHMKQYRTIEKVYSGQIRSRELDKVSKSIFFDSHAGDLGELNDKDHYVEFYKFIKPYLSDSTKKEIARFEKRQKASIEEKLRVAKFATYKTLAHEKDARIAGIKFADRMFLAWASDPYCNERTKKTCLDVRNRYLDEYLKEEMVPDEGTHIHHWFESLIENDMKNISIYALADYENRMVNWLKNCEEKKERVEKRDITQAVIRHSMKVIFRDKPFEAFDECFEFTTTQNKPFILNSLLSMMKARGVLDEGFRAKAQEKIMDAISRKTFDNGKWMYEYRLAIEILNDEQAMSVATILATNEEYIAAANFLNCFCESERFQNINHNQETVSMLLIIKSEILKTLAYISNKQRSKTILGLPTTIETLEAVLDILQAFSNIYLKIGDDVSEIEELKRMVEKVINDFTKENYSRKQTQPE